MRVALVHEVFHDDEGGARLDAALASAAADGAEVAVLPELPLNPWSPATKNQRPEDAEPLGGPRQQRMSEAAARAGIALVGGAIVRDGATGSRYNTAFVYGPDGSEIASYRKVHLPEEDGYWETSHYEPGESGPRVFDGLAMPCGLQICSDVNRPQGFQLLAAAGAHVVFAPRATPPGTYERWKLILRANAIMCGAFVITANRPRPEAGAPIGGPSLVIDPYGEVLTETTDTVTVTELDPTLVPQAAAEYPGYLKRFPELYARAWGQLSNER